MTGTGVGFVRFTLRLIHYAQTAASPTESPRRRKSTTSTSCVIARIFALIPQWYEAFASPAIPLAPREASSSLREEYP